MTAHCDSLIKATWVTGKRSSYWDRQDVMKTVGGLEHRGAAEQMSVHTSSTLCIAQATLKLCRPTSFYISGSQPS